MYIQQHYRYGELTSSHLDTQGVVMPDDIHGWLQAQIQQTHLVSYEEDGDYYWDPHEISLHEASLVRFRIPHIDLDSDIATHTLHVAVAKGHITLTHQMTSEPPVGWQLYHHDQPLPYEGTVGYRGQPKRSHFRTYARCSAEAWQKVTSDLAQCDIDPQCLMLHEIGLGGVPFSLFKTRSAATTPSWSLQQGLNEASKSALSRDDIQQVVTTLSSLKGMQKKGFEWAFLAGKIMADYGHVKPSITGELIHYGLILQASLEGHDVSSLPRCLQGDVLYLNEENQLREPGAEMFDFTASEQKVLQKAPSTRFLVIHNIPVGAKLSLRQQQAWCQHYLRECY